MSWTQATYQDVLDSRIPAALNMCPTDSRLLALTNEAQKRILDQSEAWGLAVRYRCQATEGKLVWPRQIASILGVAYAGYYDTAMSPVKLRDIAFEFLDFGMGIQASDNAGDECIARNQSPLFEEITGTTNKVGVYCDLSDDNIASGSNRQVLLLGYDENLQWIRTKVGGVWQDGEIVVADNTNAYGTLSTKKFSLITGVQKPETYGSIRLFQVDPLTLTQSLLARYDYDETRPMFRVSYIPEFDNWATTGNPITVEVLARLQLIPVKKPADYMTISNIPALKDVMSAIVSAEREPLMRGKREAIAAGLAMAKEALEGEYTRMAGRRDIVMPVAGMSGPSEVEVYNPI